MKQLHFLYYLYDSKWHKNAHASWPREWVSPCPILPYMGNPISRHPVTRVPWRVRGGARGVTSYSCRVHTDSTSLVPEKSMNEDAWVITARSFRRAFIDCAFRCWRLSFLPYSSSVEGERNGVLCLCSTSCGRFPRKKKKNVTGQSF